MKPTINTELTTSSDLQKQLTITELTCKTLDSHSSTALDSSLL